MDKEGCHLNMVIEQKPFVRYHEEKQVDSITVRMNEDERTTLNDCKKIIEQKKDSTALKQLARIGAYVIQSNKTSYILSVLFKNKHNNKRSNIIDFE